MAVADNTVGRFQEAPLSRPAILSNLLLAGDCAFVIGSGIVLYFIYVGGIQGQLDVWPRYALVSILGAIVVVMTLARGRAYRAQPDNSVRLATHATACWMGAFAALLTAAFVFKISGDFSRIWAGSWVTTTLLYFAASRVWFSLRLRVLEQTGQFAEPCAIVVGGGKHGERAIARLRNTFRLVGVFTDREKLNVAEVSGVPYRGGISDLIELARSGGVSRALIILPWDWSHRINEVIENLRSLPIRIQFSSTHPLLFELEPSDVEIVNGLSLFTVIDTAMNDWSRFVKRLEDIAFSAAALLVAVPVMGVIALAIKIDSPGPLFFVQNRYGFAGNLFRVYKFRTLHHNMADANASRLITRSDPRVTRVGRVLRRTSLDELPQLINVIRGDMSLVGPRPHATQAKAAGRLYPQVVSDYFMRYRIKPGLTGWAQVRGWRGETDTAEKIRERVRHDLYYIDHWSILFDMKILLFTFFSVAKKGTY